ncbi:MAG: hypothetical protein ABI647_22260 [Gemmatimonadota bacterium]
MPLGRGYSAEEQISGEAEHGGVQIVVYPIRAEAYERLVLPSRTLRHHVMGPGQGREGAF